jgi:hypothetical protein
MSEDSNKWLVGCGIGCGVILLLLAAVIISGYFICRDVIHSFKDAEESMERLEARFGSVDEYCPEPGGEIPADRIMIFLAVRDTLKPMQEELVDEVTDFSREVGEADRRDRVGFTRVFRLLRKGAKALPKFAEYIARRNRILYSSDMGFGEYTYIYTLAFYSWLGKDPADGPAFPIMEEEEDWGDLDEEEWRRNRRDRVIRVVHWDLLDILRNQLRKVEEDPGQYSRRWVRDLRAEVQAMEEDRYRIPYEDGLPGVILESLEPYREQLEASYSPILNVLEYYPLDEWD